MSEKNQNNRELETLYRISQASAHEMNVKSLVNEVLDVLETEFGMLRGTLTLLRPDTGELVIEASRGLSVQEQKRGHYRLGDGITGRVAESGQPAIVPDITRIGFSGRTKSRKAARLAFICVPIIYQNRVIGTMSIDRQTGANEDLRHNAKFLN